MAAGPLVVFAALLALALQAQAQTVTTPAKPIPTLQCDIADSREAYGVPVIDAALEIRPGPVDFELHMIQVTTPSNHSVYYISDVTHCLSHQLDEGL